MVGFAKKVWSVAPLNFKNSGRQSRGGQSGWGIRRGAAAADRATSKHPARQRRTRLVRAFEPETKHPVVFRRRISWRGSRRRRS